VSVVDRILGFMGIESIEDDEADLEPGRADREESRAYSRREVSAPVEEHGARPRRSALVSLPGGRTMRVVVAEPRSFEEVQPIADQLKERRPVVINLESVDKETGQKFLNFLSGTIYALDGTMQRVSTSIFVFAPANVEIALRDGEAAGRPSTYAR
jgi:cell division inhibitor SepF